MLWSSASVLINFPKCIWEKRVSKRLQSKIWVCENQWASVTIWLMLKWTDVTHGDGPVYRTPRHFQKNKKKCWQVKETCYWEYFTFPLFYRLFQGQTESSEFFDPSQAKKPKQRCVVSCDSYRMKNCHHCCRTTTHSMSLAFNQFVKAAAADVFFCLSDFAWNPSFLSASTAVSFFHLAFGPRHRWCNISLMLQFVFGSSLTSKVHKVGGGPFTRDLKWKQGGHS